MSLRSHVIAALLVVGIALTVTSAAIVRSVQAGLIRQLDTQLLRAVEPARHLVEGSGDSDGATAANSGLPFTALYVGFIPKGSDPSTPTQVAADSSAAAGPTLSSGAVRQADATSGPVTIGSSSNGNHYRLVLRHISSPAGDLVLAAPLVSVDDTITRLIGIEVIATGSILTILGLVAWWVIALGIRPIKRMTATATAIAGGDVATRVPQADPNTEAGELGAALNSMLERIEEAFTEQQASDRRLRRFAADASHELRTPLATIRGYTELYRTGGLASPDKLAEAVRRIESETVRMSDLVDELLLLARLDQRRPLEMVDLDLVPMLEEIAADARAADPSRQIDLSADAPAAVICGDENLVRRAIGNVVGNALRHTPATSRVTVSIHADRWTVEVDVADEGPGMPPEEAAHVFERFYRADTSRSRGRGGSGLGLSIVREAMTAHHGTVELTSSVAGGTSVRCRFNASPEAAPARAVPDGLSRPAVGS